MGKNFIRLEQSIDGLMVTARADYHPHPVDGWDCLVRCGQYKEYRTPNQTGNDVWSTLHDMIDLAVFDARRRGVGYPGRVGHSLAGATQ